MGHKLDAPKFYSKDITVKSEPTDLKQTLKIHNHVLEDSEKHISNDIQF